MMVCKGQTLNLSSSNSDSQYLQVVGFEPPTFFFFDLVSIVVMSLMTSPFCISNAGLFSILFLTCISNSSNEVLPFLFVLVIAICQLLLT